MGADSVAIMLEGRSVTLSASVEVARIWSDTLQAEPHELFYIGDLVQELTTAPLVRDYLGIPGDVRPARCDAAVAARDLFDRLTSLKDELGHKSVNEMHLLETICELDAAGVGIAIEPYSSAYRKSHPEGSPIQSALRQISANSTQAERLSVEAVLTATPFTLSRLLPRVNAYLRSPFFPYGDHQLEDFKNTVLRTWNRSSDVAALEPLHAFLAHGRRL